MIAYLLTSFNNFVNYLKVLLRIMIEGLGDDSENFDASWLAAIRFLGNLF